MEGQIPPIGLVFATHVLYWVLEKLAIQKCQFPISISSKDWIESVDFYPCQAMMRCPNTSVGVVSAETMWGAWGLEFHFSLVVWRSRSPYHWDSYRRSLMESQEFHHCSTDNLCGISRGHMRSNNMTHLPFQVGCLQQITRRQPELLLLAQQWQKVLSPLGVGGGQVENLEFHLHEVVMRWVPHPPIPYWSNVRRLAKT